MAADELEFKTDMLYELLYVAERENYNDVLVRELLERDPGAVVRLAEMMEGRCRCHCCCEHSAKYFAKALFCRVIFLGASTDTLRLMCDAFPEEASQEQPLFSYVDGDWTPLHAACMNGATLDVVQFVCNRWPSLGEVKDEDGCTPLHLACGTEHGPCLSVVSFLVDRFPDLLMEEDNEGNVPLHLAIINGAMEAVTFLVDRCPKSLAQRAGEGYTPLHLAVIAAKDERCLHMLPLLVSNRPQSLAAKDDYDQTPLHIACSMKGTQAFFEIVTFLAWARPESLLERDDNLCTPLILALRNSSSTKDLLKTLLNMCQDAAKVEEDDGLFPLHHACLSCEKASLDVVTKLADYYPEALLKVDTTCGLTPLHIACTNGAPLEVVKRLVERCPKALETKDVDGRDPLQGAMKHLASPAVIEILYTLNSLRDPVVRDKQVMALYALKLFQSKNWHAGVALVIGAVPSVVNMVHQSVVPYFLSFVRNRCGLDTFYAVMLANPAMVKGAAHCSHMMNTTNDETPMTIIHSDNGPVPASTDRASSRTPDTDDNVVSRKQSWHDLLSSSPDESDNNPRKRRRNSIDERSIDSPPTANPSDDSIPLSPNDVISRIVRINRTSTYDEETGDLNLIDINGNPYRIDGRSELGRNCIDAHMEIICTSLSLLMDEVVLTLREFYDRHGSIFRDSDHCYAELQWVASIVGVSVRDLGFISSSKGLMQGF